MEILTLILNRAEEVNKLIIAFIALIATISSPIITSWISRKNEVSKFREKWLYELRESLVKLEGSLSKLDFITSSEDDPKDIKPEKIKEIEATLVENSEIVAKIQLLLNPYQRDHVHLSRMIYHLDFSIRNDRKLLIDIRRRRFRKIEKQVLKKEWDNLSKISIFPKEKRFSWFYVVAVAFIGVIIVCLA